MPNISDLTQDDISDGSGGLCELMINSCDTIGRALHPTPPPIMDSDEAVEQTSVIWRIMSFFESYADLQVSISCKLP